MDGEIKFAYLEANDQSTPVAWHTGVDAGDRNYVYIYNAKRGEILKYRREIVEPKLRELSGDETSLIPELTKAFNTAVKQIQRHSSEQDLHSPKRKPAKTTKVVADTETEIADVDRDYALEDMPDLDDE